MNLELAPAVVVRASAWPIETLDAFGDANLAECTRSTASLDSAYTATIDRERNVLWEQTAGDPRFRKALLIASPSLFARLNGEHGKRVPRIKSVRHLETSLYRYLARAAARPTPSGLWAGVTLARFGERDEVVPAAAHASFAPDLGPFASALRILGDRTPYRECTRWRLGPTVRCWPDGSWRFLARGAGGAVDSRRIGANAALSLFIRRLADAGDGTLTELSARAQVPRELLDRLAEGGVLIGGLAFPTRFSSPWEALSIAGDALLTADRAAWGQTTAKLAQLAESLAGEIDRLAAEQVADRLARARTLILELFAALGTQVEPSSVSLRCDLGLPFTVTLGPNTRMGIQQSLDAYQNEWIDGLSPRAAARRERRRVIAEELARAPIAFGSALPDVSLSDKGNLEAWAATFQGPSHEVQLCPEPRGNPALSAPWGCLHVRLGRTGVARIAGMDDNPIRPWARHSQLFGANNEIEHWAKHLLQQFESRHRVKLRDLAVPIEANLNVLARSRAGCPAAEPWGVGDLDLRGAELRSDAGAIILDIPGIGPVSILSCSSARLPPSDPLVAAIAMSGFDEPTDSILAATLQSSPGEADLPRYAPRLVLSSGVSIRPRRTWLAGSSLEELTRLPRQARFVRWCELARGLGWPDRVSLSIDGGPPLTLATTSPLGVEAAFEGTKSASRIIVEEADTTAWLPGIQGHHVTDAIVPFSRSPHAFSGLAERVNS